MGEAGKPIRILAVDDHPLMRDGIAALVAEQPDIDLVGQAGSGEAAISAAKALRPDIVLMDLQMPGALDGFQAMKAIRNEFPAIRFIILTTYGGDGWAKRAIGMGAQAYMLKSAVRKELLETIRAVYSGHMRIHPEVAGNIAERIGSEDLTNRELEVLRLVAGGNANKRIAHALSVTEDTVKGHVKNILAKLRATDRTHAVTLALKRGIIEL